MVASKALFFWAARMNLKLCQWKLGQSPGTHSAPLSFFCRGLLTRAATNACPSFHSFRQQLPKQLREDYSPSTLRLDPSLSIPKAASAAVQERAEEGGNQ